MYFDPPKTPSASLTVPLYWAVSIISDGLGGGNCPTDSGHGVDRRFVFKPLDCVQVTNKTREHDSLPQGTTFQPVMGLASVLRALWVSREVSTYTGCNFKSSNMTSYPLAWNRNLYGGNVLRSRRLLSKETAGQTGQAGLHSSLSMHKAQNKLAQSPPVSVRQDLVDRWCPCAGLCLSETVGGFLVLRYLPIALLKLGETCFDKAMEKFIINCSLVQITSQQEPPRPTSLTPSPAAT